MVDKKNLNRVKGILSARQGAEIPKFQEGAKFAMYNGSQVIYSADQLNWFTDEALSLKYPGSLGGFKSIQYTPTTKKQPLKPAAHVPLAIPGDPAVTPTSAVEQVAQNAAVTLKKEGPLSEEEFNNGTRIAPIDLNREAVNASLNQMGPIKQSELVGMDAIHKQRASEIKQQTDKKTKAINAVGAVSSAALQGIGAVVGANQKATDSDTTKMVDTTYDSVASGLANSNTLGGQVAGMAMQFGKLAGDIVQELGGGTDQQTTVDKWMDSGLFSWNIGMVNGFFGKEANKFGVDKATLEAVGSSYGDTTKDLLDAAAKSGKKYGLFSSGERKRANAAARNAAVKQNRMGDIADTATDQRLAAQSMGEQAGLAYSMMTSGGYDQKYTYSAKQGGILNWEPEIELEWEPQIELNWKLPTFKEGGNIDINEELEWIPELQAGNKINLDEVRKYFKDYDLSGVEFITDESPRTEGNKLYISNDEDAIHELWHYLSNNRPNEIYKDYYDSLNDDRIIELGGDLQFVKRFENDPGHFYHPSELEARIKAAKFKTQGQTYTKEFFQNLRKNESKYGNNMRDLLHMYNDDNLVKIFSLKKGGSLGDSDIPEIEETTQKNVIPEGALHKNKHHMEHAEGLTKKGIPVIDDDGEQQAEIEHSEIIFTLEVTKKLEEYYDTFYSDESSNKEKEQAALDAGKLLVYQILKNTEDRTGLIDSCKKGGTLTLKKSTDDLIEEVSTIVPIVAIVEEESTVEKPKKKEEKSDKELMKEAIKEALIELLIK